MKNLIIISLIIISIAFFVQGLITKQEYAKSNEQLISYNNYIKNTNSFFEYLIQLKLKYENAELGDIKLINENSEIVNKSILTNKLLIYQNEFICTPCDSYIWENLKVLKNTILDSAIIITSLESFNSAKTLLLSLNLNTIDVYVDKKSAFFKTLDMNKNTLFFMLDSNYKLRDIYIANKDLPDNLKNYFKTINEKY